MSHRSVSLLPEDDVFAHAIIMKWSVPATRLVTYAGYELFFPPCNLATFIAPVIPPNSLHI